MPAQFGAAALHRHDDGNRNAGGDETILDRRGARLAPQERNEILHRKLLRTRLLTVRPTPLRSDDTGGEPAPKSLHSIENATANLTEMPHDADGLDNGGECSDSGQSALRLGEIRARLPRGERGDRGGARQDDLAPDGGCQHPQGLRWRGRAMGPREQLLA